MTTTDTLDLSNTPFYLWNTVVTPTVEEEEYVGLNMIDSVFAERPVAAEQHRTSLFRGHTLGIQHDNLQPRNTATAPWLFVVLIIITALTCLYFRQRKLRLRNLLKSLVDSHAMDRMLRGNNLTRVAQLIPMALLLIAAITIPLAQTSPETYLLLAAGLTVAYLLRNGLTRLLGIVFGNSDAVGVYLTNNYLYHLTLATAIIPLLFPFCYLPGGYTPILYIIVILTVLEFIIRLFRGLKLFLTQSSGSQFYLFYYLCIVEIAPVLILIKYITN